MYGKYKNAYKIAFLEHDYFKEPIQYYNITFTTIAPSVLYMVLPVAYIVTV